MGRDILLPAIRLIFAGFDSDLAAPVIVAAEKDLPAAIEREPADLAPDLAASSKPDEE